MQICADQTIVSMVTQSPQTFSWRPCVKNLTHSKDLSDQQLLKLYFCRQIGRDGGSAASECPGQHIPEWPGLREPPDVALGPPHGNKVLSPPTPTSDFGPEVNSIKREKCMRQTCWNQGNQYMKKSCAPSYRLGLRLDNRQAAQVAVQASGVTLPSPPITTQAMPPKQPGTPKPHTQM